MAEKNNQPKPNFKMPGLDMNKLNAVSGSGVPQMTTREEQEQYKIMGVQDGKVKELLEYEKRKNNDKKASLGLNGPEGSPQKDQNQDSKEENGEQEKKKKKKKRKKNKGAQNQVQDDQSEMPTVDGDAELGENEGYPKNNDRFKHNIMASHDLYADSADDSEDEGIKEYQMGGYHPVHLGEVLIKRYVIIQKLGWGQFSTVWLAKDMKFENTFVALKVQKSAPSYKVAAYDEVEILDVIQKNIYNHQWLESLKEYHKGNEDNVEMFNGNFTSHHTQVVQLLNSFMHYGANGDHFIMVFEILGVNLLEIMKRYDYKGIPMPLVRKMSKQILIGLDYLHRICKIIHTDLKPENTIVALSNDKLNEIVKNGCIPKSRKKYEASSNLLIDKDQSLFSPSKKNKIKETLLQGINTDGMSKQQKKKLKAKIKKEQTKDEPTNETTTTGFSGSVTQRETSNLDKGEMNMRTKAAYEQLIQMNENEEDLVHQRPRSHSVPNLLYQEPQDYPFDDDSFGSNPNKRPQKTPYAFNLDRNFGYEIQEYIMMRKELQKRKEKLQSGEIDPEDLKEDNKYKGKDPREIELSKKQMVNVSGPMIDESINAKICDLGNGCWTHFHFVPKIQTRQYRAPEVIMGIDYDASTDMWSFACMIFELITGDFLFNPRPGDNHKKNDDHLALFMEMLGPMPKKFASQGSMYEHYFMKNSKSGKEYFRRIHDLRPVKLEDLLIYRYQFKQNEAKMFADFLMKILKWYPSDRPTAQEMLEHPWLTMSEDYNYKMSEIEFKIYELRDQATQIDNFDPEVNYIMDYKANLMNQNNQHHVQMDIDQIELYIKQKESQCGANLYKFPGQLAESDYDDNEGDIENNLSSEYEKSEHEFIDSESDSWNKSGDDAQSFNSDKLIDGFADFQVFVKKIQAHRAQQEVEKEENGGFKKKAKKSKSKKSKKGKKSQNPFGESVLANTSPESRRSEYRSRSASLEAVQDRFRKLIKTEKDKDDAECELNISFSGGYVPNTDLSRVDKGLGNPQFKVDVNN